MQQNLPLFSIAPLQFFTEDTAWTQAPPAMLFQLQTFFGQEAYNCPVILFICEASFLSSKFFSEDGHVALEVIQNDLSIASMLVLERKAIQVYLASPQSK